jgi:UDP-GlcNAc3NAcA epimerase
MKIITILGARPQFIKSLSLSQEFNKRGVDEIILHTGQHFDESLNDIFYNQLSLRKPKYFLEWRSDNKSSNLTCLSNLIPQIEKIVIDEKPSYLLVYGDTDSTLIGALVAGKMNVKLIHVEAGLRSFNKNMPEEINRIIADHMSTILFCPTLSSKVNLINENIKNNIFICGDIMYDSLQMIKSECKFNSILSGEYSLLTIHRASNTDDLVRLNNLLKYIGNSDRKIIWPIHPRTKKMLIEFQISIPENIKIIDPVGYIEIIELISNCYNVITDSGGLQKEAFYLNKYCIILRDETEWVELLDMKVSNLIKTGEENLINSFINNTIEQEIIDNPYTIGSASKFIVDTILNL